MSATANAPSMASSCTSIVSMPAFFRAAIPDVVIFLPSPIVTSPAFTSLFERSPTRLPATDHLMLLPSRCSRSTLWNWRRISSAPRSPRARRKTDARNLRLRSMRTYSRFFASYSNSTHDPRYGMICAM